MGGQIVNIGNLRLTIFAISIPLVLPNLGGQLSTLPTSSYPPASAVYGRVHSRTYVRTSYARTQHGSFLVLASYVCNPQFMSPTCFFQLSKTLDSSRFLQFFHEIVLFTNWVRFRQISISETRRIIYRERRNKKQQLNELHDEAKGKLFRVATATSNVNYRHIYFPAVNRWCRFLPLKYSAGQSHVFIFPCLYNLALPLIHLIFKTK